jgi:hypothetical protein
MKKKKLPANNFVILPLITLLLLGIFTYSQNVYAREAQNWSIPDRIYGLGNMVLSPYLIADQNRTVHAFVSDWVGMNNPQLAVMYLWWSIDTGWTIPVDIILPERGQARIKGAFLDERGVIHLAFWQGDDLNASIYHTYAFVENAGNARGWSNPQQIGSIALAPDEAILLGNSFDHLFVVYFGSPDRRGLYISHSQDYGASWSSPMIIYVMESDEQFPSSLNAYMGIDNWMQLVWTVRTTDREENEKVYYARVDTETYLWEAPIILKELDGALAYSATIIEHQGELFAIYHDDDPTTRWMRRSIDGGNNWSVPVRLFDHLGSNGPSSLIIDNNNELHMFFGNRVGWPSIHGLWHSIWQGHQWSQPIPVISGPPAPNFDPGRQQAVVSQGNVILVTWIQELGRPERNGVWYSYMIVDAPAFPVHSYPTQEHIVTSTPAPTRSPNLSPTSMSTNMIVEDNSDREARDVTNLEIISLSILYTMIIISAIIGTRRYHQWKKR